MILYPYEWNISKNVQQDCHDGPVIANLISTVVIEYIKLKILFKAYMNST